MGISHRHVYGAKMLIFVKSAYIMQKNAYISKIINFVAQTIFNHTSLTYL